jgi:serine/threonine protein kinase
MSDTAPMTPERLLKVSSVFHAARNVPLADREAFLEAQCANDVALRREVESLLRIEPGLPTAPGPLVRLRDEPLPVTEQLGRFRLVALVGIGGMGVVYQAHDPRLGRDVALKVLLPEVANDPERVKRFEREARATARLSHPNIVPVFEFVTHDGTTFIVSEFVKGPTLRRVLEDGRLEVRRAIDVAIQLAEGLAAAHAADIIHRDLKPENVLMSSGGSARIVDFGLAKTTVRLADSDEVSVPGT